MLRSLRLWRVSAAATALIGICFFAGIFTRVALGGTRPVNAAAEPEYVRLASAAPQVPGDPSIDRAKLFYDVLNKLRIYYVDPLPSDTTLAMGGVEGLLQPLDDPASRVLSREEVQAIESALDGEFKGIGAVLTIRRYSPTRKEQTEAVEAAAAMDEKEKPDNAPRVRMVTVVSVAEGSPAAAAGLQPGDRITEIDGRWIAPVHLSYRLLTQYIDPTNIQDGPPRDPDEITEPSTTPEERAKIRKEIDDMSKRWGNATDLATAMAILYGPGQAEHELTIERGQPVKTLKVKVRAAPVRAPLFEQQPAAQGAVRLHLRAFTPEVTSQFAAALAELKGQDLVLDLRGCAGGLLSEAQRIAGLLMGEGKWAQIKERDERRQLKTRPLVIESASPVAIRSLSILVDGGTAGSAELLAAALREQVGAKLVGSTTFGDGHEQELIRLENGQGISLTRSLLMTAGGKSWDGGGLKPDLPGGPDPVATAVKALSPVRHARVGASR